MKWRLILVASVFWGGFFSEKSFSWNDPALITKMSLESWDVWEDAKFVPLESVLPDLIIEGKVPASRQEFFKLLDIQGDRISWDDFELDEMDAANPVLAIIALSSAHPAQGLDGPGNPDSGLNEKQIYWGPVDWRMPLVTFHFPKPKISFGSAIARAQQFFTLAQQAKAHQKWYWAYRFLGMTMFYVQRLSNPFYSHQFGSLVLLPYKKMFSGKQEFSQEFYRVISNFRETYNQHVFFLLKKGLFEPKKKGLVDLLQAFRVSQPSVGVQSVLETTHGKDLQDVLVYSSRIAAMLAPSVVREQLSLMEKELMAPSLDLRKGFFGENGMALIDFSKFEGSASTGMQKKREQFIKVVVENLSNYQLVNRWVLEKFRSE